MKKNVFMISFLLIFIASVSAKEDFTNDSHFSRLVKEYNVESIICLEDIGKIVFDPIIKITLDDGRHFIIKHAFSKNPKKLMLFALDDYKIYYGIEKNGEDTRYEFGIYFAYLEKYFDFKISGIEDIIIHYDEIREFIEYLDTFQDYIFLETLYYTKYKNIDYEEPRYCMMDKKRYLRIDVRDSNRERRESKATK